MTDAVHVTAVVVTFNRPDDLDACLDRLDRQTRPVDRILVVDNASDEPTTRLLGGRTGVEVLRLTSNLGGAGGFATGVEHALDSATEWLWLMDDDCLPNEDALAAMLELACEEAPDVAGVVPAVAFSDGRITAGALRGAHDALQPNAAGFIGNMVENGEPTYREVDAAPFIAPLLRAEACRAVGVPRAEFFIWGDDIEYLLRLRAGGGRLLVASRAVIHHPWEPTLSRRVLGKELTVRAVAPWKEYYGTRNRIVIDRQFRSGPFDTDISLGRRLRDELKLLLSILAVDPRRWQRLLMRAAGTLDAYRGRSGMRVRPGASMPWQH